MDALEQHAFDLVAKHVGEEGIYREMCLCYGRRAGERVQHTDGEPYSPPTIGSLSAGMMCVKTVKVALRVDEAIFAKFPNVAYHGVGSVKFENWQVGDGKRLHFMPPKDTDQLAHGSGVYATPSFHMAVAYSYWRYKCHKWSAHPQFGITPDGKHFYAVVLMIRMKEYEKKHCTAFSGLTDGWDKEQIEYVCADPASAGIYNVLVSYIPSDGLFPRIELTPALIAESCSAFEPCVTNWRWELTGRTANTREEEHKDDMFVLRTKTGQLTDCSFCHLASTRTEANTWAYAFTKHDSDTGKRTLAVPRFHVMSVGALHFWRTERSQLRMLLWSLKQACLAQVRESYKQDVSEAVPVLRDGVWVYDLARTKRNQVLLIFHTIVSREHLHLHGIRVPEDGGGSLNHNSRFNVKSPSTVHELGLPGTYSVTWHQIFAMTWNVDALPCCRDGCGCSTRLAPWWRSVWNESKALKEKACPPSSLPHSPESERYCCGSCKEKAGSPHARCHV